MGRAYPAHILARSVDSLAAFPAYPARSGDGLAAFPAFLARSGDGRAAFPAFPARSGDGLAAFPAFPARSGDGLAVYWPYICRMQAVYQRYILPVYLLYTSRILAVYLPYTSGIYFCRVYQTYTCCMPVSQGFPAFAARLVGLCWLGGSVSLHLPLGRLAFAGSAGRQKTQSASFFCYCFQTHSGSRKHILCLYFPKPWNCNQQKIGILYFCATHPSQFQVYCEKLHFLLSGNLMLPRLLLWLLKWVQTCSRQH